jgi:dimethylargininase
VSLIAITSGVSAHIGRCELTHLQRQPIDVARARQQHQNYQSLLSRLGCTLHSLPAADDLPDSVFVEDTALVLDEIAIVLRPGAASRRPETARIAPILQRFRQLRTVEAPGRIDGGDILRVGRDLFLGASSRTNAAAVAQVRAFVAPFGYHVHPVPVHGVLHLKSAATALDAGSVLINPRMVQQTDFGKLEVLSVHPEEPFAANALLVGATIVYPEAFPRTAASLLRRGFRLEQIDVSEIAKAEGALTCCSLIFEDQDTLHA